MKDWGEIVQDYNVDRASSRAEASEEATLHQVSTFTATSIHILANNPQPFVTIVYFDNDTVNFTRTFFSEKSLLSAVTFILWGVNAWIKLQSTINLGLEWSELLEILKISERPTWRGRWAPMHHGTLGFGWRAMENVSLSTYTHVPPNKIYVRLFISLV